MFNRKEKKKSARERFSTFIFFSMTTPNSFERRGVRVDRLQVLQSNRDRPGQPQSPNTCNLFFQTIVRKSHRRIHTLGGAYYFDQIFLRRAVNFFSSRTKQANELFNRCFVSSLLLVENFYVVCIQRMASTIHEGWKNQISRRRCSCGRTVQESECDSKKYLRGGGILQINVLHVFDK